MDTSTNHSLLCNYTSLINSTVTNCTNETESGRKLNANMQLSVGAKVSMYICFGLIFLLGTTGNTIVIYIVGIKHKIVRNFDLHIISLSLADLLASISLPILTIHDLLTNLEAWHLGIMGCKILPPMNHVTILVSAFMLVIISISRLRVIASTKTIRQSKTRSLIEIGGAWLLALCIVSPFAYKHTYVLKYDICYDAWHTTDGFLDRLRRLIYYSVYEGFGCFIPMIIMGIVYTKSVIILNNRQVPGNNKTLEVKRKKQNKRIIKMFGTIVFVFLALTTPYMINVIIVVYYQAYRMKKYLENTEFFFNLNYGLFTLSAFNSCINPFIYARMHHSMKKSFNKHVSTIWKTTKKSVSEISVTSKSQMRGRTFTNITVTDDE
ncbi:neuropeptides B/W receptor type 1-like [Hydractinia symbiolongicarpus]|uniref:neuropeptides B/W receptor type 1-like n=1 Tax=Hydractinia symbiolongicarpus TaxID=13093 RepID=UPI00254CB344|nr:neuropeptides B/W receptor type 1-like [Hydractinia symbiolongicarpus]